MLSVLNIETWVNENNKYIYYLYQVFITNDLTRIILFPVETMQFLTLIIQAKFPIIN